MAAAIALSSCAAQMSGTVKDDVSVTGQTGKLAEAGLNYNGPSYNVAILTFANKTPGKVLGIGEAATDILRTIVKKSGLEPVGVGESEMQQQEELIKLQQTGAVKTGKKSAAEGFESIDFRISGAITSYSEANEGVDYGVYQKKEQVARVQVDYALVDIATGKSLVADSGMGEYRKSTGGALGFGSKSTYDVGLREGALRDALTKAMTKMIDTLNALPFQSRILQVKGASVIVRAGTKSKLAEGTVLGVYRQGDDIVDPDTGRVIGKDENKIGELMIVNHMNDKMSKVDVRSGTGFKAGDLIKAIK
ncbi:MAG: hypothetical protein HZB82_00050 [Deltaproteobacteria bacterium]|nr:hypothetical protein [Deltaproteobacteria bacterium]